MAYWIYKCNRKPTTYASDTGDWARVFQKPWTAKKWGTLAEHPDLVQVAKGDLLLCQQSDVAKKLLVGLASVLGVRDGKLLIKPIEAIGVVLKPLKDRDMRISGLDALKGGKIQTVYEIPEPDARYLLRKARSEPPYRSRSDPAPWKASDETRLGRTREMLKELPAKERAIVAAEVRRVIRNALLRSAVLRHWPARCAACGCHIEVGGLTECEVAHIRDVHGSGMDQIRNALPLCRTHHWAFDRLAWAIRPSDHKIVVRQSLKKNPSLRAIHGRKVVPPTSPEIEFLGSDVLAWRWQRFEEVAS